MLAACVVIGQSLAACTSANSDPVPLPSVTASSRSTPSPTPTPTIDPAITQAEAAILDAYRGYWAAKVASYADPTKEQDPNLAHFAVDKALTDAQSTILSLRTNGIAVVGTPVLSPVVSDTHLGDSATARISDCVDVASWQPIYTSTGGSAAAPGQALRVQTDSTAYFFDGHWTIRTSVVNRDASC